MRWDAARCHWKARIHPVDSKTTGCHRLDQGAPGGQSAPMIWAKSFKGSRWSPSPAIWILKSMPSAASAEQAFRIKAWFFDGFWDFPQNRWWNLFPGQEILGKNRFVSTPFGNDLRSFFPAIPSVFTSISLDWRLTVNRWGVACTRIFWCHSAPPGHVAGNT